MGSHSSTVEIVKDQSADLSSGVGTYVAPESIFSESGSTAIQVQAGKDASLSQVITGITGTDANALLGSAFDTSIRSQEQVVSLANTALAQLGQRAAASEALATALTETDYGSWLPYLLLGAVVIIYLGAR